jgi:hypothetical protein
VKSKKPITRWNILALVAALLGTGATLGIDHWWMGRWINSGDFVPVGGRATVLLEPGRVLAYYESVEAVPQPGMAHLHVIAPAGNRLPIMPAYDDADYAIVRHGWTGRLLWEFHAPESGIYDIGGYNNHYLSDDDIPAGDRIVIGRSPELLAEAMATRNMLRTTGVGLTMLLVVSLYVVHVRAVGNLTKLDRSTDNAVEANDAGGAGDNQASPLASSTRKSPS